MAIALRGTPTTGSAIDGGNITLTLPTGLQVNDIVVVGYAMNAAAIGGTSSGGWTQIGADVTNTTRIQIFRKVMGSTPDANIVLTGSGLAADSSTAIAFAASGVDTTRPEGGVALTSATGSSTNPDPPSITPALTGSAVFIYAATSLVDTTGTNEPSGYAAFTQVSSSDTNSCTSYAAVKASLVGGVAEDPGPFSGVSTAAWAAYTMVMVPQIPGVGLSVNPNVPPAYLRKGLAAAVVASCAISWTPQVPTAAAPTQYNYGFHNERHVYRPIKPAVGRLGTINLAPAQPPPVAFTTTEWIFAPFSQPVRRYQHRRGEVCTPPGGFSFQEAPAQTPTEKWWTTWAEPPSRLRARPRLEGFSAWPGIGYTTTVPVPTPTEWWRTQWQDPAQFLRPRRSVGLLGQFAWDPPQQAAPTEFTYGVHNERHLYSPAKRSPDLLGGPDTWPAQVPTAVVAQVTLSPGPWSGVPAAYWAQRRNWRIAASWPWQAYSFTVPAATPTAFWMPVWQERPKERKRSVYLRQGSWAGWDPQFIIQITPPAVLEGVTFTFGLKRGASATPGTKEGATMTGQRKVGGATLITRVKPRVS